MANWKGTPVPNSGTLNKLYFNTNLSNEEIVNIVNSLVLIEAIPGIYAYNVVNGYFGTDEATFFQILIQKYEDKIIIEYKDSNNGGLQNLFTYNVDESENGWASNVVSPIIPSETPCNLRNVKYGFTIGDQNDKLSSLFSITPFEEVQEEVTLDSWAEDIADAIREKKGIEPKEEWVGTPIPSNEMVSSLYLNTDLTIEEVKALINSVEMVSTASDGSSVEYDILYNSTVNGTFCIRKDGLNTDNVEYQIGFNAGVNIIWLWNSNDGWLESGVNTFNQMLLPNLPLLNELEKAPAFNYYQNDKLSGLLSLTPFEKKTTGLIPRLNFAQEIRSIETGSGELLEPTAVPISGMIDKVYFNFNVDVQKMCNIVKGLNYVEVPDVGLTYPIISNADMTSSLTIIKNTNSDYPSYLLVARLGSEVKNIASFESSTTADPTDMIYLGENHDLSQPLEFGFENQIEALSANFPTYVNSNELLKEMISITPIQKIGGSSGSASETLLELRFNIVGTNLKVNNVGVLNNPDNVPIYKATVNPSDYSFSELEVYSGDITLSNISTTIQADRIDKGYITAVDMSNMVFYFIKLQDLDGKTIPYLSGVEITRNDTTKEGMFFQPSLDGISKMGNFYAGLSGSTTSMLLNDSYPTRTIDDLQLSIPQELYIIER